MSKPDYPGSTLGEAFGLILLTRFVEKIGVRVFPDWTGTEATVEEVDLLPELAAATNGDRICAALLLNRHHPDLGRQDFISPPWSAADNERRHQLWHLAQQLAEGERKEAAPALRRLRSVQTEIIRQSSTGKLILKICRVQGGPWEDFQPEWWNRHKPEYLFDSCIIDPAYPFSERPNWKPNTDSWIFAPTEGVDQIVACLTAPQEAKPQSPHADSVDPPKPPVTGPEVASPPPADAMPAETATPPPKPATLIDAANAKPPEPNSDRQSEQRGNPVWDWSALVQHLKAGKPINPEQGALESARVQHLEAKKLTFNTEQDALEYYRNNVQRIDQMKAGGGPDEKTVRRANKKYDLHQYVTIKRPQ
jgi:hypothetical protein